MITIQIPLSKLIKFIPSEPDGGVIPGKVVRSVTPFLKKSNPYTLELKYSVASAKSSNRAVCVLDEELDIVKGSNRIIKWDDCDFRNPSRLHEDGVTYVFEGNEPHWEGERLFVPSPFVALGNHDMSHFVPFGRVQIACLAAGFNIRMAVIGSDVNRISSTVIELKEMPTFGPPCQHGDEWLIPWETKSQGINITRIPNTEMDAVVSSAGSLP